MNQTHSVDAVHAVEIRVNEQPVRVHGARQTGLAIKEAALSQGVRIELTFVLSEELGHRRSRVVGDTDVVEVHAGSRFHAVPPDDNS